MTFNEKQPSSTKNDYSEYDKYFAKKAPEKSALIIIMKMIYNLIIIAGTAYLVQAHNWSLWWFLVPAVSMINITYTKKDDSE